jgi:hypothetical protein
MRSIIQYPSLIFTTAGQLEIIPHNVAFCRIKYAAGNIRQDNTHTKTTG